jgi:hypothetical protein
MTNRITTFHECLQISQQDHDVMCRHEPSTVGLDGRMPEQEFDLLEIPAVLPAQFRASPAEVMGAEVFDPDLLR